MKRRDHEPTILIVDDDHSARRLLAHALEREGYRLYEAADGAAALLAFASHHPDLVLMDSVMPVMDGFTACRTITAMADGRDVPVLMVTGLDDEQSVNQAFAAGAADFIPKPVNWAVLRQRVRRTLALQATKQDMAHLAFHDNLTGLPNRRLFLDRLGSAIGRADRTGTTVALLFLDLDRFKSINDTMGHDAGDEYLRVVADRLVGAVRDSDTVARLGGDEFTVILEGAGQPQDIAGVVNNVIGTVAKPLAIAGQELLPHCSIGVAVFPIDGRDIATLLKHADMAMYRAKEIGRDRYQFFTAEMGTGAIRRSLLERTLHEALTRDQFHLVYAPRVDVSTGNVVAVESLLRWEHPELGQVAPNEFLGIAEESDRAAAIGDWVMREACRQLAVWHAAGARHLRMAINVSMGQLRSRGLARRFQSLLREYGLAPADIDLELNERSADRLTDSAAAALRELCALGVSLVLDDFGTGHTSLLALRRLPVRRVKLDRSYVSGLPDDPDCAAIAGAVAAMAGSLGLDLVAEGVETVDQLAFIRQLGCPQAEGFLFARPMPADSFSPGNRFVRRDPNPRRGARHPVQALGDTAADRTVA